MKKKMGRYVGSGAWPQTVLGRCRLVSHIWPASSIHASPPHQSPRRLTNSYFASLLHTVSLRFLKIVHRARQCSEEKVSRLRGRRPHLGGICFLDCLPAKKGFYIVLTVGEKKKTKRDNLMTHKNYFKFNI